MQTGEVLKGAELTVKASSAVAFTSGLGFYHLVDCGQTNKNNCRDGDHDRGKKGVHDDQKDVRQVAGDAVEKVEGGVEKLTGQMQGFKDGRKVSPGKNMKEDCVGGEGHREAVAAEAEEAGHLAYDGD